VGRTAGRCEGRRFRPDPVRPQRRGAINASLRAPRSRCGHAVHCQVSETKARDRQRAHAPARGRAHVRLVCPEDIADVEARGATPVVLSLTVRNIWTEAKSSRIRRISGKHGISMPGRGNPICRPDADPPDRYQSRQEKTALLAEGSHAYIPQGRLQRGAVIAG